MNKIKTNTLMRTSKDKLFLPKYNAFRWYTRRNTRDFNIEIPNKALGEKSKMLLMVNGVKEEFRIEGNKIKFTWFNNYNTPLSLWERFFGRSLTVEFAYFTGQHKESFHIGSWKKQIKKTMKNFKENSSRGELLNFSANYSLHDSFKKLESALSR